MNKYYTNKEHKADEKRMDKQIIKNLNDKTLTTEQKIQIAKELQRHLSKKKRLQTAEMPLHEYAIKETSEIIEITREHALELKRNGHKLIPIIKDITKDNTNTTETINLTIDLSKVKREKWADECWNGKNLINTNSNLPKGNGTINETNEHKYKD